MNKPMLLGMAIFWAVPSLADSWPTIRAAYDLAAAGEHVQQNVVFVLDTENGKLQRARVALEIPVPVEGIDYPFQPRPMETDAVDVEELDAISDTLERTILEEVQFQGASLLEVLRALQKACDEQNPPDRRVTFALRQKTDSIMQVVPVREIRDEDPRTEGQYILLTLSTQHISAAKLLNDVVANRATKHVQKGRVVFVRPRGWLCSDYIHRMYNVGPHLEEVLLRARESYLPEDRLKECLAIMGTELSEEAKLHYMPAIGMLANLTLKEHDRLERVLRFLEEPPPRPGRFRLHGPAAENGPGEVLLLDTDTGRTWRYRRKGDATEGLLPTLERFELVPDLEQE